MKTRLISFLLVLALLVTAAVLAVQADSSLTVEEANALDNSKLVFADDGKTAYCPVCKTDAQWTKANTGLAEINDGGHHHAYLTQSFASGWSYLSLGSTSTVCLHLNGFDIRPTNAAGRIQSYGTLNIMGNGTVLGGTSTANATLEIQGGTVNLYGGTYTSVSTNAAPAILLAKNTAKVNMYAGATVGSTETITPAGVNVKVTAGTFNMYGGIIRGGTATTGGNVYLSASDGTQRPAFNMYGGKITGGQGNNGSNMYIKYADVTISAGAVIDGGKSYNIYMAENAVLNNYGTITPAAGVIKDIQLYGAEGTPATYNNYVEGVVGNVSQNAYGIVNSYCQACKATVAWKTKSEALGGIDDGAHYHYYIAADQSYTWGLGTLTKGTVCLHLNGKTITEGTRMYVSGDSTLRIMGNGKLIGSGNESSTNDTGTITVNKGTVDLYGGEYISTASNGAPVILLNAADAKVNVYDGVIIGGEDDTAPTGTNVMVEAGEFAMYGGTVRNGVGYNNGTKTWGGNIYAAASTTVNVYGGTVEDGTAARGGNIAVYAGWTTDSAAELYISKNAAILNGTSSEQGGNIDTEGYVTITTAGDITGGESTGSNGGNVFLNTFGTIHITGGKITGGKAAGLGGNLHIANATILMEAGEISGGEITSGTGTAHNISLLYTGNLLTTMTMTGGTVMGTECTQDHSSAFAGHDAGTAIYINGGKLTLSKEAVVSNSKLCGNIYVSEEGSLSVEGNWTGEASVDFAGVNSGYGETIANGVSTGDYTGTLLLEYNHMQPNIYGVDGKLVVSGVRLYLADGTLAWPKDNTDAVAKHLENEGSHIKATVNGGTFEIPAGKTVLVDFNGKTASITGSGTLCGMDGDNDGYEASGGVAAVANTVTVQVDVTGGENGYRYIALKGENGTYSFHRLNMRLTTVSLRTSACGIYYKAQYECDDVLAEKVSSYGVVFSVNNMPGADFMTEEGDRNLFTFYNKDSFVSGVEVTSGSIFGIMKEGCDDNVSRGEMPIYANAYIIIDGVNEGQPLMAANGVAYSLLDVLKAIDTNWAKYVEAGQDGAIKTFYGDWADKGMSTWADRFDNIA